MRGKRSHVGHVSWRRFGQHLEAFVGQDAGGEPSVRAERLASTWYSTIPTSESRRSC